MVGSTRERDMVKCCNCKQLTAYNAAWACVPYGRNGIRLPLPTFLHCRLCASTKDATELWMQAFHADKQAGLPDPVKLAREEELNRKLSESEQ
jgi:hypothetical protein